MRRRAEGGSLAAMIPNLEITGNTATRSRSVSATRDAASGTAGPPSHTPWQMLTACLRLGSPGLLWRSGSSTISSPLSTEGRFQKFSSVLDIVGSSCSSCLCPSEKQRQARSAVTTAARRRAQGFVVRASRGLFAHSDGVGARPQPGAPPAASQGVLPLAQGCRAAGAPRRGAPCAPVVATTLGTAAEDQP
jgi:hypothetical protein